MKVTWTLLTIVLLLNLNQIALSAEEIYRWVDENGKVHYGDKPKKVDDTSTTLFDKKELQSIETKKAKKPRILIPSNNRKKSYRSSQSKSSKCEQLKSQISKLNEKLRKRQSTRYFEQLKSQLSNLRARRLKEC